MDTSPYITWPLLISLQNTSPQLTDGMKTCLLLLVFISNCVLAWAQPTLVFSNSSPVDGDAFAKHTCGVSAFTMGSSGAFVTWNFSGLSSITTDTVIYAGCTGSAFCDSFTNAYVGSINGGNYQFFATDTNSFALAGVRITGGNIYYAAPRTKLFYPATFNAAVNTAYSFYRSGYSTYGYGTDSIIADGYGTLVLPSGTYANVLRVHTISINIDSNIVGGIPSVDTFRTDIYAWYTPGFHNPLLTMLYDFTTLTSAPELAQIFYYTQLPEYTGVADIKNGNSLQVFPNPATDELTIQLNANNAHPSTIAIFNVAGRTVLIQEATAGRSDIRLDVSSLQSGMYFLRISSSENI